MKIVVNFYQIARRLNLNTVDCSSSVWYCAADRHGPAVHQFSTSHRPHADSHTTHNWPNALSFCTRTLCYIYFSTTVSVAVRQQPTPHVFLLNSAACLRIYRVFLTNGVQDNETHLISSTLFRRVREKGTEREEVTRDWRKFHNDEHHDLYWSPDVIKVNKSRRSR